MPFVLRNGVYDNVPPAAVEEFDLLELFFQFHPQAFGQGAGVGVLGDGLGEGALDRQAREAIIDQGKGSLVGVARSPVRAGDGAAEGGLALSFVFDAHTASADQGQVNDGFSLSSIHWAGLDSM